MPLTAATKPTTPAVVRKMGSMATGTTEPFVLTLQGNNKQLRVPGQETSLHFISGMAAASQPKAHPQSEIRGFHRSRPTMAQPLPLEDGAPSEEHRLLSSVNEDRRERANHKGDRATGKHSDDEQSPSASIFSKPTRLGNLSSGSFHPSNSFLSSFEGPLWILKVIFSIKTYLYTTNF
jgi:hypothetical protein